MTINKRMVAEFDAATAPFMSKLGQMSAGVRKLQMESAIGFAEVDQRAVSTGRALVALKSTVAALGSGAAVYVFRALADSAVEMDNQMRGIGITTDDTKAKVFALAMETRTPIEATVGLMRSLQKSLKDQTIEQTMRQVGTLNRMLTVGGLDGNARASVALQFGQALQSGVLQGDELRSLREAAPIELLEAIARAAGGTVEQLRDLGSEGKLTRDVMVTALEDLESISREKFAAFKMTTVEAAESLRTAMIATVGSINEGSNATETAARVMQGVAEFMARNQEVAEALGRALVVVAQAALILAGGRGLGVLGAAIRVHTREMVAMTRQAGIAAGALRGVRAGLAIFGGPVGLAISAAAIAMTATAASAGQLETGMDNLEGAMRDYETAINDIEQVNADLLKAKRDLTTASENYRAAVAEEGPVAQEAARLEVEAINEVIKALDRKREARVLAAQESQYRANVALENIEDPIRQRVESDIRRQYGRNAQSALRDLMEDSDPDPSGFESSMNEIMDAFTVDPFEVSMRVSEKLADIRRRIRGQGEVSPEELEWSRAERIASQERASMVILNQRMERAEFEGATGVAETTAIPTTSENDALNKVLEDANLVSRRVAALREEIALLQGEIDGGGLTDQTRAESEEAIAAKEAAIERLLNPRTSGGRTGGGSRPDTLADIIDGARLARDQLAELQAAIARLEGGISSGALTGTEAERAAEAVQTYQLRIADLRAEMDGLATSEERAAEARRVLDEVVQAGMTSQERIAKARREVMALLPAMVKLLGDEARAQEVLAKASDLAADRAEQNTNERAAASNDLKDALEGIRTGALDAEGALDMILSRMLGRLFDFAFDPVFEAIGEQLSGAFSGSGGGWVSSTLSAIFGSAKGNVFDGNTLVPFAQGGVFTSPQRFPMADGRTGLMAEAGTEAIMPLERDSKGRLGVSVANYDMGRLSRAAAPTQQATPLVQLGLTITLDDDGRLAGIAQQAGANAAMPVAIEVVRKNNETLAQRRKRD